MMYTIDNTGFEVFVEIQEMTGYDTALYEEMETKVLAKKNKKQKEAYQEFMFKRSESALDRMEEATRPYSYDDSY